VPDVAVDFRGDVVVFLELGESAPLAEATHPVAVAGPMMEVRFHFDVVVRRGEGIVPLLRRLFTRDRSAVISGGHASHNTSGHQGL
jgi:hypothetical protein